MDGKANASLGLTGEISLYGGGEVTGPLLRNGQYIKLWNTDTGAYGVDGGKRLYQSHPWVLGVRRDGSAFGILFDSSWKSELHTNSDKIEFNTEGALFRIYIIDRESPKDVLKGLAELTGTITMPARWTLGYHQCRFSYGSEQKVREIADNFRSRNIPCDAIWMDIDYMDGYRIFTFNETTFPDPKALNEELHQKGFKAVYMIDPGAKVDKNYHVYQSGTENDVWVKRPNGEIYEGKVVSIKEFGAFIEFAPGKEGMVHISKISNERINHVEDVLTLGDHVKCKCMGKDKMGRISFSIKDAM